MTVFIELVTDAFDSVFASQAAGRASGGGRSSRAGLPSVRRPTRGIEVKDDTYAFLRVVLPNGRDLPLLTSSSRTGYASEYTNFILQSVQEMRMERHQIVETFGDAYIFFFGEHPRFLDCQAKLINTHDFNWRAEWWENYEKYLRGTRLVELGARCYMFWDDVIVEGYIVQAACGENAELPAEIQLQFKFFVTKYTNISLHSVEQFPVRASARIPDGIELTAPDSFYQLQSAYKGAAETAHGVTAIPREVQRIKTLVGNPSSPGNPGTTITGVVRQLPPSFLQDPAVWKTLVDTYGIVDPWGTEAQNQGSVRGLIADNRDEFVSQSEVEPVLSAYFSGTGYSTDTYQSQPVLLGNEAAVLGQTECEDLTQSCINTLESIGCRADDPQVVAGLGLGPNFSDTWRSTSNAYSMGGGAGGAGGVNLSAGRRSSDLVTFGASASASAGLGASASGGLRATASASAGYYADDSRGFRGAGVVARADGGVDPLGQVYGRSDTARYRFSANRPRYLEGTGDYEYGYGLWAAYGGVGFGQAGYGDFGGNGYGSANGAGDPGFRDPDLFTYRKVRNPTTEEIASRSAQVRSSDDPEEGFSRFMRQRSDNTALTSGEQLGAHGGSGSGSISVRGRQSAFALLSVSGTLEEWVIDEARASTDGTVYISHSRLWEVDMGRAQRQSEGRPR